MQAGENDASWRVIEHTRTRQVLPHVRALCLDCHDGPEGEAGIDLRPLAREASWSPSDVLAHGDLLERVAAVVRARAMPPEFEPAADGQAPPFDEAARVRLARWVDDALDLAETAGPVLLPRRVLRRLTRWEMQASVLVLTGLEVPAARWLPPDDVGYGFDNNGDVNGMSPLRLSRQLQYAAEVASRLCRDATPARPWHAAWGADRLTRIGGQMRRTGEGVVDEHTGHGRGRHRRAAWRTLSPHRGLPGPAGGAGSGAASHRYRGRSGRAGGRDATPRWQRGVPRSRRCAARRSAARATLLRQRLLGSPAQGPATTGPQPLRRCAAHRGARGRKDSVPRRSSCRGGWVHAGTSPIARRPRWPISWMPPRPASGGGPLSDAEREALVGAGPRARRRRCPRAGAAPDHSALRLTRLRFSP